MIEKINWQKELLESGKFNDKFQKTFSNMEQKTLCKESILDICIPDGEK